MATKTKKVPVSRRAVIARINRKLARDDEQLRTTRGMQAFLDLGDYYTVDVRRNWIARKDVDLDALGRELGVLKDYEKLSE